MKRFALYTLLSLLLVCFGLPFTALAEVGWSQSAVIEIEVEAAVHADALVAALIDTVLYSIEHQQAWPNGDCIGEKAGTENLKGYSLTTYCRNIRAFSQDGEVSLSPGSA